MIGLIHIVIGSFHVCYVNRGALRRLMHTKVCIGLDIASFPSLMYGFIMQQKYITSMEARLWRASLLWRAVNGVSAKALLCQCFIESTSNVSCVDNRELYN